MFDLDTLKFDEKGLITAVVQDADDKDILMVAYMNRESLEITMEEGRTCYYSRSRQTLWRKGETSEHIQKVKRIMTDCDKDCLLILVEQTGPACHTNKRSCFFNEVY